MTLDGATAALDRAGLQLGSVSGYRPGALVAGQSYVFGAKVRRGAIVDLVFSKRGS
jgi:hypothetical protein